MSLEKLPAGYFQNERDSARIVQRDIGWVASDTEPLAVTLPKDLLISDEQLARYDRVMYALGSSDIRAAIFLLGLSPEPLPLRKIIAKVKGQLPEDVSLPHETSVMNDHLRDTVVPVGLAEEVLIDGKTYYRTSEEGELIGKPIAARLLRFTAEHDQPLATTFGFIGSAQGDRANVSRSYINRPAVLLAIRNGATRRKDVTAMTGIASETVKRNLENLRSIGLINYESHDPEFSGRVRYERTPKVFEETQGQPREIMLQNILKYFRLNQVGTSMSIALAIGRVREIVYPVLPRYVDEGYLTRTEDPFSRAAIIEQGNILLDELVLPILQACSGEQQLVDALAADLELLQIDPSIVARAMNIHKEKHKRYSLGTTKEDVLEYITRNGPSRVLQLRREVGHRAPVVLRALVEEGRLEERKSGKAHFYYLPGSESEIRTTRFSFDFEKPRDILPPKPGVLETPEEFIQWFDEREFWDVLTLDLQHLQPMKLANFGYYFSEYNSTAEQLVTEDKKLHKGKYFSITGGLITQAYRLAQIVDLADLPDEARVNALMIVKLFLLEKAPPTVRDLMCEKFPADFSKDADGHVIAVNNEPSTSLDLTDEPRRGTNPYSDLPQIFASIEQGKIAEALLNHETDEGRRSRLISYVIAGKQQHEALYGRFQGMVTRIARDQDSKATDRDELIDEGNIGLLRAIDGYQWRAGAHFPAYARRWIKGKTWNVILGRDRSTRSLDAEGSDGEPPLSERLSSDQFSSPEDATMYHLFRKAVDAILQDGKISQSQIDIIALRFGLLNEYEYSVPEIANMLDIPEDEVENELKEGMENLRTSTDIESLRDYLS